MKFGVHSFMIVDDIDRQTIDELAATAASWGADGVEVHTDLASKLPIPELKKAGARHGLEWTLGVVLTAENNLVSPDAATRRAGVKHITSALRKLDITGRLGDPHRMLTCAGLADLPTDFVNA